MKSLTNEEKLLKLKEKFEITHCKKYSYDWNTYSGNKNKMRIICPEHGEFWTSPNNHSSSHNSCGCPKCSKTYHYTTEEFIKKAKIIHKNKFNYDKTIYIKCNEKVEIICPEHGEFWQIANDHLKGRGCPKCGILHLHKIFNKGKDKFIKEATLIHKKYDYSKVNYVNAKTKICVICPEHGEFFITPDNHITQKQGCPVCIKNFTSEIKIKELLDKNNIKYIHHYNEKWLGRLVIDFYLPDYRIAIEVQGEQHFKPVRYFGGSIKHEQQCERDERKYNLCVQNDIKMLYFTYVAKHIVPQDYIDVIYHSERSLIKYIKKTLLFQETFFKEK